MNKLSTIATIILCVTFLLHFYYSIYREVEVRNALNHLIETVADLHHEEVSIPNPEEQEETP